MKALKYFDYLVYSLLVAAALSGCQGKMGPAGPQGASGQSIQGPQGVQGPQGPAGLDGTQITVVQFCPGVAPSYPTTFPEVGLCISGHLYAVYSANDGFLTEVVDGTYDSNAVGSSCTFTVSGCNVQ